MIELYQAEWCPYSHRVRKRLTELGLDFVARQVPAEPAERAQMHEATAGRSIPTLVDEGRVFRGPDTILAHLDETYREVPDVAKHRANDAEEGPAWRDPTRKPADTIGRIVLGFDGSDHARRAAARAALVALDEQSAVVVVNAVAAPPIGDLSPSAAELESQRRLLAEAQALLEDRGVEVKSVERTGEPARVIVEVAREIDADLVVVGTRGHNLLERALGSISAYVVQHAPCDVLVVR